MGNERFPKFISPACVAFGTWVYSAYVHSPVKGAIMADKTYKFVCVVCGFEVEVDTPELPEDYVCPVCGVGPDEFEAVEE